MVVVIMVKTIVVQNDPTYLFVQWLGWDWNFWTMIFAQIITIAIFFGIIFLIGFVFMCLGWLE